MKKLYIFLGSLSLALGVVGIFIPLLPTTPFLLIAASLYFRGSERLYVWLIDQKYLGVYIRNFRENKTIPLRAKVVSVCLVWITIGYCAIAIADSWWFRGLFILLAVGITIHILSFATLKKEN